MISFSNWRILQKLLTLVGAMSLVIAAVAAVGLHGLTTLDAETDQVAGSGLDSALGERIRENVIGLSRAEFRAAVDPSAAGQAAIVQDVEQRKAALKSQVAEARKNADEAQATKLDAVEKAMQVYLPQLDKTLAVARRLGSQVAADTARQQIADAALADLNAENMLSQAALEYADVSNKEMDAEVDTASKLGDDLMLIMTVTAAVGIAGGLALGYLLASFGIARPIDTAVVRLKQLSEGDTDSDIMGLKRKDEIGDIANTMQVFRENLIKNQELQRREMEAQLARGRRAQAIETLTESFDRATSTVLNTVSSAAGELQATAALMTQTAEETASQATVVASASEETTTNVQTVAAATEELSASIREIGNQVTESSKIVGQAVNEAQDTNGKVQSLSDAAQKIGDVVRIISEIAGQTNLLALNATIEAARAGEMGKGFAVVASEVKTLATQTAKATDEITGQVRAIQDATASSAAAIQGIGATINRVSEISSAIAGAVEEQGAATAEISRNVQEAAHATQEVSANIASVTTAAEHTGVAAAQVLEASNSLAKQAEVMRAEVEKYICGVRAA